jgi:hypothetical protein
MPEQLREILHFTKNWQQQLAEAFNNIEDLCHYLHLSLNDLPVSVAATKDFPLRVPLSFAACMQKGNPHDPLLRQVLPIKDELFAFPLLLKQVFCTNIMAGFCSSIPAVAPLTAGIVSAATFPIPTFNLANKKKPLASTIFRKIQISRKLF